MNISNKVIGRPIKIAVVTTTGFHLVHLAKQLIDLGHDVTYYSYHPSFKIRRDGIARKNFRSQFFPLQPLASGALFRYAPNIQKKCTESLLKTMDEQVAHRLEFCDVLIGLSGMLRTVAKVAREKYQAKVIADRGAMHVLTQSKLTEINGKSTLSDFYIKRELESYDVADYVALPSIGCRDSFVAHGFSENKLFINHYGVDLSRFIPTKCPDNSCTVIFVGNWSYTKAADIISAAAFELSDINFIHVGTVGNCPLPQLANFKSLGHVPNSVLNKIYATAHILILPSRQDGFGMVMLEALASGLHVIASERTGGVDIKKIIQNKDNIEIVEAGSMQSLVNGIKILRTKIICGPKDRFRRTLVDSDMNYFSWRSYAERYSDFIKKIAF